MNLIEKIFRESDGIPRYYNSWRIEIMKKRNQGKLKNPPKSYSVMVNIIMINRWSHAKQSKYKPKFTIGKYQITIEIYRGESVKHSNKRYAKERKKELQKEAEQLARLNELFIPGLQYDKDTGIITSGNIPIIKDIENGYEQIYYDGKQISSHRLIFKILKIDIQGYDVHHIDRNKRNNKFNNLQLLKRSEHMKLHSNMRNKKYGKMQTQKQT